MRETLSSSNIWPRTFKRRRKTRLRRSERIPKGLRADLSSSFDTPAKPAKPAADVMIIGDSERSGASTSRVNKTGADGTTLTSERRTALSDTQSEDRAGATPKFVSKVKWDISGSVQCSVETKAFKKVIASVYMFLEQVAFLPGRSSGAIPESCDRRYSKLLLGCRTAVAGALHAEYHCQEALGRCLRCAGATSLSWFCPVGCRGLSAIVLWTSSSRACHGRCRVPPTVFIPHGLRWSLGELLSS